jgi:hypothetical protein
VKKASALFQSPTAIQRYLKASKRESDMVINKEIALQDFIDREEAADNALDEEQAAEGIMKLRRG